MGDLPPPSRALLKSLHAKVGRVADVLEALVMGPPPLEKWPHWLESVTGALAQYETVLRDLRPALGEIAVIPSGTDTSEAIPNVLLRSKLAPEVETRLNQLAIEGSAGRTGALFGAVAQMIQQEAVEPIKAKSISRPATPSPRSAAEEDERLVQAVRSIFSV